MGADKVGTKSGGFFHLFDWNRKSRKKLFANETASPEGTKHESKNCDNFQATRLRLIGDDAGTMSCIKDNSDYSCASSVTDEGGNGIKAPGVVARLMGLDSMPNAGTSELYSSPLLQPQSLKERQYQKSSSSEFEIDDHFITVHDKTQAYSKKPPQSTKTQRIPNSPIERFQTEMLPPRSAKSLPLTHYKLLSPIKNPRFISSKDAAHIMEAAAKILEPHNHPSTSARTPSLGSSSLPVRVRDLKECMSTQRLQRLPELSKRPNESNATNYLRGKPLSKSWNGSESDTSKCRASQDREELNSIGAKSKGKSISLAIQAKVNVQRREGRSPVALKEQEEFKSSHKSIKNQANQQKDRLQRKVSGSSASGVLKQNNKKQNCLTNKEKLFGIPSTSQSQGRKAFSREAYSSARTRTINKSQGNSNGLYRRKGSQTINVEKEVSSSVANLSRKKRTKVDHDYGKNGCVDLLARRQEKCIQHNVIIDEKPKQDEDQRKNSMDVVSFTFTSTSVYNPESKSIKVREKQDAWKDYYQQAPRERYPPMDASSNQFSGGDALSVLLEKKLQELTFGMESFQTNIGKGTNVAAASTTQDLFSASENFSAVTMENCKDISWESCTDNDSSNCDSGISTLNSRVSNLSQNLQESEVLAESKSCCDAQKESDQRLSPFSILESSFSYESCNSSESCDSGNGSTVSSSIFAQDTSFVSGRLTAAVEAEMEVSDSASSSFKDHVDMISRNDHIKSYKKEVEYVREILSAANLDSKNFAVQYISKSLNLALFDQVEKKKFWSLRSEDVDGRVKRRALFDCIRECLDLKAQRYFNAGFLTWRKGVAIVGFGEFSEEIYKEILTWSSMVDWMVDELVDKDMGSPTGNWLDFEQDAFKMGMEIETKILSTLINEVVAEFKF